MTRIRVFAGFALAFLIACGGGATPSETPKIVSAGVIKQAFANAVAAKSARMAMTMELRGVEGASGTVTGSGLFSLKDLRGVFTFDFSGMPGTPFAGKMEQRLLGGVLYMRIPGISDETGGKPWLKLDFEALSKVSGIDLSQLSQFQSQDPTQTLAMLQAVSGDVRRLGTDRVRDVQTTHYAATVELDKVLATLPDTVRKSLNQMREQLSLTSVPIEVWIGDEDKLVRRMTMRMDLSKVPAAGQGSMTATIEMYDFGVPVSVTAPPASQVADFADVLLNR